VCGWKFKFHFDLQLKVMIPALVDEESDDEEDDDFGQNTVAMHRLLVEQASILAQTGDHFAKKRRMRSRSKKPRRKRISKPPTDWCKSTWGIMLDKFQSEGPSPRDLVLFRRRFRVPFELFRRLVTLCREKNLFAHSKLDRRTGVAVDAAYRQVIPLELKMLGVLRILGRGWCLDDVTECSGIAETTMSVFFHEFCSKFVAAYYFDFVKRPENEDLIRVMDTYSRLGFPGDVGSIDCTRARAAQEA